MAGDTCCAAGTRRTAILYLQHRSQERFHFFGTTKNFTELSSCHRIRAARHCERHRSIDASFRMSLPPSRAHDGEVVPGAHRLRTRIHGGVRQPGVPEQRAESLAPCRCVHRHSRAWRRIGRRFLAQPLRSHLDDHRLADGGARVGVRTRRTERHVEPALGPLSWVRWKLDWAPPGTGKFALVARSTDKTGARETEIARDPFPNGATGWDRVEVIVTRG